MEALKAAASYHCAEIHCFVSVRRQSVVCCLLVMLFLNSAFFFFLLVFFHFFFFSPSELFNSCASNHFGLRLETGEIQFVMADCAVLLAHPETRMATLVSAVGWLSVDFTHRSLTISEGFFLPGKCCKYSPDSILLVPHCAFPVPYGDLGVIH